jgi:hypothetical protein
MPQNSASYDPRSVHQKAHISRKVPVIYTGFLVITETCQQSFVKRHSTQFRDNPLSFSRVTPGKTDACKFGGALLRFLVANSPEVSGRLPFSSTCSLPLFLQASLHQQEVLPLRLIKSCEHTARVPSTRPSSWWSHFIPC